MRICFISHSAYGYFNPNVGYTGGGAQRQFSMLARRLTDEFDVHFIVGDYGQPQQQVIDGVTLHRSYAPDADGSFLNSTRKFLQLYRTMRAVDADLYLTRSTPRKAIATYLLSHELGSSHLFHISHENHLLRPVDEFSPPFLALYKHVLSHSAAVVCQTDRQSKALSQFYGVNGTQIPNGYPTIETIPPYDEREYFLWVGRLSRTTKRPHLYLDLAENNPEKQFFLIGPEGRDKSYNRRIQARSNDLQNVKYIESIPPNQIDRYYREAIALVNTSAVEGFPNIFLEAWRLGTPTLSLSLDLNQYLDDIDILHASDDIHDMNEMLQQLADRPELRKTYGERLRDQFETKYSMSAISDQYITLLDKINRE